MEELVSSILSRLPPKSLIRFKCVHKSWNALTYDLRFVAKHLTTSRDNKLSSSTSVLFKRFALLDVETQEKEIVFSSIKFSNDDADEGKEDIHSDGEDFKIPHWVGLQTKGKAPDEEPPEYFGINSHCNGILCLADCHHNLVLWNPATKEFKHVPKSCLLLPPPEYSVPAALGLGYDPKSDAYKLIQVVSYGEVIHGEEEHVAILPPKAEAYTVGSDCWREIKTDYLETETTIFWPECFQVCLKGIFYWLGHEQHKHFDTVYDKSDEEYIRELVVVFDIDADVFQILLYPECFYDHMARYFDTSLGVWNESIALYTFYRGCARPTSFELWALDDFDSNKGSWTKHVHFEPFPDIIRGIEFWKGDEVLMIDDVGR